MRTCKSSPTGRWLINVIGATGSDSLDLVPLVMSRNSSVYSCSAHNKSKDTNGHECTRMDTHEWRSSSISNASSSISSGLWQNHQNAKKQSQNDSQINNQSNRNLRKNKSTLHSASIHNNIFTTNAGHAIAMFTPWLFDHHLRSFWWSALLTVW